VGFPAQAGLLALVVSLAPSLATVARAARAELRGLDLHLETATQKARVEGDWEYTPADGTGPYGLTVRATHGGFYEYEGVRAGSNRPIVAFDRSTSGPGYRGEVLPGFDGCIPAGARFSLVLADDVVLLDPSLPVETPIQTGPGSSCVRARRYFLSASGRGEEVRLRPLEDLVGALPSAAQTSSGSRAAGAADRGDSARTADPSPAASFTLSAPMVPDGTEVAVLGSRRDGNDRLWHHVRLLEPLSGAQEKPEGKTTDSARKTGEARVARPPYQPPPDRSAEGARVKEPPSGYVMPTNLVVRWECRLQRGDRRPRDGTGGPAEGPEDP